MPNKTIYVSESDVSLFEEAKNIAGEALSSVIARSLREYVTRNKDLSKGMKEIAISVGTPGAEQEKRFIGAVTGKWQGFSDDRQWWMNATLYRTQKGNWAVYLVTIAKATLLTDKKAWKESGDYLLNPRNAVLFVGPTLKDFEGKVPTDLLVTIEHLMEKNETPVEFLDI